MNNISLGFKIAIYRQRLGNQYMLKTLVPKHQLFLNPKSQEDSGLTQDDLVAIQKLDASLGRYKRLRYFRRTKEQVKAIKYYEQIKKETRKQRIKAKKLLKIQMLIKEVEELDYPLITNIYEKKKVNQKNQIIKYYEDYFYNFQSLITQFSINHCLKLIFFKLISW